ncbi:MAG TPA: hypothetical protein VES69_01795 [Pyrinomonadaceae bacterium]|nr:hypothetical protein [Pyrinomonadaceae bacterium]
MKLFWLIVAGGCVAVAAVFLLWGDFDRAFVVAAVGMLAWFLNYRMQVKAALATKDSDQEQSDGGGVGQDRKR